MKIIKAYKELYNGSEFGFTTKGVELLIDEDTFYFRYSDLLRFSTLINAIGSKNFERVINLIQAKIKLPGIYSSYNGYSLSYLKINKMICVISHEEIQPDAYKVFLEGIISDYSI